MSLLRDIETEGIGSIFYRCPTARYWIARRAKHPAGHGAQIRAYMAVSNDCENHYKNIFNAAGRNYNSAIMLTLTGRRS